MDGNSSSIYGILLFRRSDLNRYNRMFAVIGQSEVEVY